MSTVDQIRAFNRFYTQRIGVLDEGLLRSPYSLAEVRVLWELGQRQAPTAGAIARDLGLDAGYLSRMLARLERAGLLTRRRSRDDGRQQLLGLSARGRRVFADLDARSADDMERLLRKVAPAGRKRLLRAMRDIEQVLGGGAARGGGGDGSSDGSSGGSSDGSSGAQSYVVREPQPGDLGWIVHRHGVLYAEEYGWDARFEALVAGVVARFVERLQPARERCFIVERAGENVGSAMVVAERKRVARLRLLLVEPSARGLGIGGRLVDECLRFARQAGYREMVLWTNSVLHAARRVYERAGFRLVEERPHAEFGRGLVGQTFSRPL